MRLCHLYVCILDNPSIGPALCKWASLQKQSYSQRPNLIAIEWAISYFRVKLLPSLERYSIANSLNDIKGGIFSQTWVGKLISDFQLLKDKNAPTATDGAQGSSIKLLYNKQSNVMNLNVSITADLCRCEAEQRTLIKVRSWPIRCCYCCCTACVNVHSLKMHVFFELLCDAAASCGQHTQHQHWCFWEILETFSDTWKIQWHLL